MNTRHENNRRGRLNSNTRPFIRRLCLALTCVMIFAAHHQAVAQQITCPVDAVADVPDGSFNAFDCEITAAGTLRPAANGTFTNLGAPDNAVLTINGGIEQLSGGGITYINEAGATIENNGAWNTITSSLSSSVLQNAGTTDNNSTGSVRFVVLENTATFNNAGLWEVITSSDSNTNSGDIFNLAGGSISFPRFENQVGGMVENAGMFQQGVNSTLLQESSNAGDIFNSGTFLSEFGDPFPTTDVFNNTATGTFTNQSGGQATFVGGVENRGTITNEAGGTMTHDEGNGAFTVLDGGQLINEGTFNANSNLTATGAGTTITNSGMYIGGIRFNRLDISAGATLNNQAGGTIVVISEVTVGTGGSGTINNAGVFNVDDPGRFSMIGNSILNNADSGVINFESSLEPRVTTLDNAGVVNVNGLLFLRGDFINRPGGTFNVNFGFVPNLGTSIENAGAVNINVGSLFDSIGGRYTQTAGSTQVESRMQLAEIDFQGGTLTGTGSLEATGGPLTNTGASVEPGASAGTLTVTGDYTQDQNGTYVAELGGLTPDTEHDVLVVTGDAVLAGRLEVRLIDGFVPQVGDTFEVLRAGSINGEFDTVVSVPAPLAVTVDYTVDTVTVTVTQGCDSDDDGVCDVDDLCPGGDDSVDTDGDGVPDLCDPCPQDNPDDANGDGFCDGTGLPVIDNPNGQTVPGTECCGGGVPMMMPFMLMGWTWKRRRNRRRR
ncbi:MAG: hypothetical protein MI923_15375 [Phycisphaerales bacterium]|nr:hypothetical protein [Phycisphaerales bacterium]